MKVKITLAIICIIPFVTYGQQRWTPDNIVLQHAGSIGFVSLGAGYSILNNKANIDLLFGYVPRFTASRPLETATLKFTAYPWRVQLSKDVTWHPVTTGVYFCYTFGSEFKSKLPAWYPDGYYWWSEAVRANIFLGGALTTSLRNTERKLGAYYEVGTNELKLVSYAQNRNSLRVIHILHVGIGLRYHL